MLSCSTLNLNMAAACHICYVRFDSHEADLRPRMLPCGHTFCTGCLRRLLQLPGASQTCPTCRRALPAAPSGLGAYSLNYALEDLLRENLQISQEQTPEQNSTTGQAGAATQGSQCAAYGQSSSTESIGLDSKLLHCPLQDSMQQNLQVSHEQVPEQSDTTGQAQMATQGIYAGLVARLQSNIASQQQQAAEHILNHALLLPPANSNAIIAGVVPLLVDFLRSGQPAGQLAAAVTLVHLTRASQQSGDALVAAGVVPPLTALLGSDQPELQCMAVSALQCLADGSQQCVDAMVAAGAMPLLVALLRSEQPYVQHRATSAVASIAAHSPQNRDAIIEAGAVPLLIPLMKRSEQPAVQQLATAAVWYLSRDASFAAGAVGLLGALLRSDERAAQSIAASDLLKLVAGSQENDDALRSDQPAPGEAAERASTSLLQLICTSFLD